MHRRAATVLLLGMIAAMLLVVALPAAAEVTKGECTGQATFPSKPSDGQLTADRPRDEVFDVPEEDDVQYSGMVAPGAEPSEEPVDFSGGLVVSLPRFQWQVVGWEGSTEDVEYAGVYTYEVPGFVPRGTGPVELTGKHSHEGYQDCEAVVTLSFQGERGVVPVVTGAVTVLAGLGTVAAGRRRT